jgi:hypothetical protein
LIHHMSSLTHVHLATLRRFSQRKRLESGAGAEHLHVMSPCKHMRSKKETPFLGAEVVRSEMGVYNQP